MTQHSTVDDPQTASSVPDTVRAYLIDEFLLGTGTVTDDASLLESGVVDSTGIVELATFLEVRFGITIDDDDMTEANLDSIERIARFVERKRRPGSGAQAVE